MKPSMIEDLTNPFRLSFPVIAITTFEMSRAQSVVEQVAKKLQKDFIVMPFKQLPTPNFVNEKGKANERGAVIFDMYFSERIKANPETLPALKASIAALEAEGVNYVIVSKDQLNEEFVYHLSLPEMDAAEITTLLKECERNIKQGGVFTEESRKVIANHARGLSYTQMKNVFAYCSYLHVKNLPYLDVINKEKAHILRDIGLDVLPPMNISEVGGLNRLKDFLMVRKAGWDNDLPVKGILLAGVPGGGKTLTAKAAADVFGTTLVRLDMGRFYSKYLGDSEKLFNRALATIEEISPIVVLIDEMEKTFGQGSGEHEVSKRMLGNFLYWLQERKKKVFIVATANRIQSLPPELMRAGRWDRSFFIDMPTNEERQKIFEIHLMKNGLRIQGLNLSNLLKATQGFTGAEIEQAIIDALYLANAAGGTVNEKTLLTAISQITPTSETRREDIDAIRLLKDQGFYPANEETAEKASASRKVIF